MASRNGHNILNLIMLCGMLLLFSFLSFMDISVLLYLIMIILWMMVLLVFSGHSMLIRRSRKVNPILFVITFFCGTGYYIKAFKVVFAFMSDDMFIGISYGIVAYFLVFIIMVTVIMYFACLMFRKQKRTE